MSKYELIQWYPSLPDRAKNRKTVADQHPNYSDRLALIVADDFYTDINKKEVENNPDFWEEVQEKSYEILTLTPKKTRSHVSNVKNTFQIYRNVYEDIDHFIECFTKYVYDIHSVERLSDGEVFTVGDRIHHVVVDRKGDILSINLSGGKIYFSTTFNDSLKSTDLKNAAKIDEPLFTTEDGVDIYKGDTFYYIPACIDWDKPIGSHEAEENVTAYNATVRFYDKKKAEQWVKEHKPQYSKADINRAFEESKLVNTFGQAVGQIHKDTFFKELDNG